MEINTLLNKQWVKEEIRKYLETMKEMTSGKNNKIVYMPYEASAVLSSIDGIKEMLMTQKSA